MSGQVPWQNGRRAWQRLNGWHHPGTRREPVTAENREVRTATVMHALKDIRLVRGLLDQAELGAVREARRCGKGWADIGTMLGVSRQTAWERWHEDDESPPAPDSGEALC